MFRPDRREFIAFCVLICKQRFCSTKRSLCVFCCDKVVAINPGVCSQLPDSCTPIPPLSEGVSIYWRPVLASSQICHFSLAITWSLYAITPVGPETLTLLCNRLSNIPQDFGLYWPRTVRGWPVLLIGVREGITSDIVLENGCSERFFLGFFSPFSIRVSSSLFTNLPIITHCVIWVVKILLRNLI